MIAHRQRFLAVSTALLAGALLPGTAPAQTFSVSRASIGGDGGTDYLAADTATGRVYVSRGTHVMVVDGATAKVVADIGDTPRVHGIAFAQHDGHGFTTNAGDSTSTMFDLASMAPIRKIHAGKDGLDGIMYDDATDKILTIDHSRPDGTAVVIDAKSGDVVATIALTGRGPEGGVSDGKGRIFINLEDKNAIDVVDSKTWKVVATWPIAPCEEPTGIAMDRATNRIFAGCSDTSVVVDATSGKVVAKLTNGDGVDALGWDAGEKLIYIPAGRDGTVTVYHEDSADRYTKIATVKTMPGVKTIAVDEKRHVAYGFTPEYGPAPAPAAGEPAPPPSRFPRRGPVIGTDFFTITH
ncbi:MAG: YncE family protein [Gemmatimonadetes bacterium]|nr:YncE family protein [Gemmatimonadota bacterium]